MTTKSKCGLFCNWFTICTPKADNGIPVPCCLLLLIVSLLPQLSRLRNVCSGLEGLSCGPGGCSRRWKEPSENQSSMASCYSRVEISLSPFLACRQHGLRHCPESPGRQSVPVKHRIIPRALLLSYTAFPKHQQESCG